MLLFLVSLILLAIPVIVIIWWKRFYAGLVIGQIILLTTIQFYSLQAYYQPLGWIANYHDPTWLANNPQYTIRWILPSIIHYFVILGICSEPWIAWLYVSSILWFLALCTFYFFLQAIGFNQWQATIGAILPAFTFGFIQRSLITADVFNFFVVIAVFFALFKWDTNKQWVLTVLPLALLALAINPPVSANRPHTLMEPIELIMSAGIWALFALYFVLYHRDKLTRYNKLSFYLLPIYIIVAIIAVDWDRWFVLGAPIWVPLTIMSLTYLYTTHTTPKEPPEPPE